VADGGAIAADAWAADERDRYSAMLQLFGDIITEIAIVTDGDEGLFVGYSSIVFTAPVYAGDFIEATGTVVRIGDTSRTVEFEARKVIASRYDVAPSAADLLDEPIVVCRATGTTVIPREHSRKDGQERRGATP
jgi:3-aminobutyryl-CoA ammonia-lyase